jgi:hypothetical protein
VIHPSRLFALDVVFLMRLADAVVLVRARLMQGNFRTAPRPGRPEIASMMKSAAFSATLSAATLSLLVPCVTPFVVSAPKSSQLCLAASSNICKTQFQQLHFAARSKSLHLSKPRRIGSDSLLCTLQMSSVGSILPDLENSFEAALISSIPDADEAQMEELLAILTTSVRSLERRMKQGKEDATNAKDCLILTLRYEMKSLQAKTPSYPDLPFV